MSRNATIIGTPARSRGRSVPISEQADPDQREDARSNRHHGDGGMGHTLLGQLKRTRRYQQVVALLAGGADAHQIA